MRALYYCVLVVVSSPYSRNLHTDAKYHRDLAKLKVRHKDEQEFIKNVRISMEKCYQIDNEYDCLSTLFNHDYFWL